MSFNKRLLLNCEIDTKKALRQGKNAISGAMPSWLEIAKKCISSNWSKDEEQEVIQFGEFWCKRIQAYDEGTFKFWSSWFCSINETLQNSKEWQNLDSYNRIICGIFGDKVTDEWLLSSDGKNFNHIWWVGRSSKNLLKNAVVLSWILNKTKETSNPMVYKVWKGVEEVRDSGIDEALLAISEWSNLRVEKGIEVLTMESLLTIHPINFWERVFDGIDTDSISDENFWFCKSLDKELLITSRDYARKGPKAKEDFIEKWNWLINRPILARALISKRKVFENFIENWGEGNMPDELKPEKLEILLERSALSYNRTVNRQVYIDMAL